MTLSDLHGHSPIADFFKWDILYSFVTDDKNSIDLNHHSFPLRLVSYVFTKYSQNKQTILSRNTKPTAKYHTGTWKYRTNQQRVNN